ncbi:MAG TPA: acyl-ACP thioesterase domain-containing protein [Acidimicrobiales bacterium]|nr:acyl-ACP thioesterase domain-containing protein [Acidimicrobiales bacterium]
MLEFVPLGDQGRRFSEDYVVRLSDADERGRFRLDGVVRFLQDVATDDWSDTGIEADETWVVRRTRFRMVEGARWPQYLDRLRLTTWCGGVGAAWAERRTNIDLDGVTSIEAAGLWVPIGPAGTPIRLRGSFFDVYGEAARARKVSGRVDTPVLAEGATMRPWPLREADLDLAGHVNTAAVWQALSEVAPPPVRFASVTHHQSLERDDDVVLASAPGALWLVVDGAIKVSATYEY